MNVNQQKIEKLEIGIKQIDKNIEKQRKKFYDAEHKYLEKINYLSDNIESLDKNII